MATRIWCLIGFRVGFATVDDVEGVGSEYWHSEVNMGASKGASRYLTQIGQNVKKTAYRTLVMVLVDPSEFALGSWW